VYVNVCVHGVCVCMQVCMCVRVCVRAHVCARACMRTCACVIVRTHPPPISF